MNSDAEKKRYFLELSYHGGNYHGWQIQANSHTVQAELNNALSTMLRETIETMGAGRTDTGVHARQYFAHLETGVPFLENAVHQLNGILPADISLKRIIPVKPNVNARFDALSRTYEYWLYRHKNPFLKEFACFYPFDLDLDAMNDAAQLLLEHTDFASFSKSRTQVKTTDCYVKFARWYHAKDESLGERIVFEIKANRFLRNMVRALTGTFIEVGRGNLTKSDFRKIIEGKNRSDAGVSVPACGLYLTQIEYNWQKILLD